MTAPRADGEIPGADMRPGCRRAPRGGVGPAAGPDVLATFGKHLGTGKEGAGVRP